MALRLVSPASVMDTIAGAVDEAVGQGGLLHVAIARADGLVIAHNLPNADLAKRLAAMSAAIVGTAQMASSELKQGMFQEASLMSAEGRIACIRAGNQAIVAGLGRPDANVGLVLMALRQLAAKVETAIARLEEILAGAEAQSH